MIRGCNHVICFPSCEWTAEKIPWFLLFSLSSQGQAQYALYFLILYSRNISPHGTSRYSYKAWKFRKNSSYGISLSIHFYKQSCITKEWHDLIQFEESIFIPLLTLSYLKSELKSISNLFFFFDYVSNYWLTLPKLEESPLNSP